VPSSRGFRVGGAGGVGGCQSPTCSAATASGPRPAGRCFRAWSLLCCCRSLGCLLGIPPFHADTLNKSNLSWLVLSLAGIPAALFPAFRHLPARRPPVAPALSQSQSPSPAAPLRFPPHGDYALILVRPCPASPSFPLRFLGRHGGDLVVVLHVQRRRCVGGLKSGRAIRHAHAPVEKAHLAIGQGRGGRRGREGGGGGKDGGTREGAREGSGEEGDVRKK
jgi:hypothetical protein